MTDVAASDVSGDAKNTDGGEPVLSSTARALERISVSAPYFALEDLTELGGGIVAATVPAAPPQHPETGSMEAAQVARHLAILGSCAAALARDDNKRHHYLATKAHYSRLANAGAAQPAAGEPLQARSDRLVDRPAKRSGAYQTIDPVRPRPQRAGRRVHRFGPQDVLSTPSTARHRLGEPHQHRSSVDVSETDLGVDVSCGPIPSSMCAGHFADYPAAPVAIVMGQLCRAAGRGLAGYLGIPIFDIGSRRDVL